jgi:broad specificity phosphatase PhoE/predicted kinase
MTSPRLPLATRDRLTIVMVGLPARGKSFLARKVARWLSWLGLRTRVFNVGSYRRALLGAGQPESFFDPSNVDGQAARRRLADAALDDLVSFLREGGEVAIYDATNSTRAQRAHVEARLAEAACDVMYLESICDDESVIDQNVRETKLSSPDYVGIEESDATRDFRARIAHYARVYEPVDEPRARYVKLIDVGRQVIAQRVDGYLPARIVFFLLNLHISPRVIWLTRHGESTFNVQGRIGGDSGLSESGESYARALSKFIKEQPAVSSRAPSIWTSTLRRSMDTARHLPWTPTAWRALDEIDAGTCDGMTYEQIARELPGEFQARKADKFTYRYPRGESYRDVIERLEPVIFELERTKAPLLVVGHQAVIRALYAYLMDRPPEVCPHLPVPLSTVIELTPTAYGCSEKRIELDPMPERRRLSRY